MRRTLAKIILLAALAIPASAALAVDNVISKDAPTQLGPVRAKIDAKDWNGAIADLQKLAISNPHADVYNLLGYSLRNTGDYAQARTFYAKALDFEPGHLGAHEYLGELYIKTGELDKAKAMVVKLEKLCPAGCEELADLKKDVAEATAAKNAPKTN
jgi:Flp pilus assembly protein TadD